MILRIANTLYFILFLSSLTTSLRAQTVITGTVTDSTGQPIRGANVTTTGGQSIGAVRAFALTNEKGQYRLTIASLADDSIYIKAGSLGYTMITIKLPNKSQEYYFRLKPAHQQLPEVRVSGPPVFTKQDTLNYDVAGFTSPQDRAIADVLKRLPGVEVSSTGQILYQGKPIQQLTVDGLNLLEAKYGLISQHLPADMVSRIQVVENDQHLKVLDSLIPSDLTTINLKLKKLSATGSAELGIGASPLLRQVNLIPMLFNRKFQMVHAFISNNTGADGIALLQSYQVGSIFQNTTGGGSPVITSIVTGAIPPFKQERWLNNNINQWSSNFLRRLKKDWILKVGFAYTNDHQLQYATATTTIYTPGTNPVHIVEDQSNRFNINRAYGSIVIEKNTQKLFLRNHFTVSGNWHTNSGSLIKDQQDIWQRNNVEQRSFSNRLNIKKRVGNQVLNLNSVFTYTLQPEYLLVKPGPFPEVLNDSVAYAVARQRIQSEVWATDHSVGFTKKLGGITANVKTGLLIGQSRLGTQLMSVSNTGQEMPLGQPDNRLRLSQWAGYADIGLTRNFLNGYISLDLPLQVLYLRALQSATTDESRFLWQPRLYGEYRKSNRLKWYGSVARRDTLSSNPASLYESLVLTNYRTLQRYVPVFQRTKVLNARAGMEYKKILQAFWMNAETGIEQLTANFAFVSEVLPDGTSNMAVLPEETQQMSYFALFSLSKLYVPVRTLVKLLLQGTLSNYERILNGERIRPVNQALRIQADIVNTLSEYIQPSLRSRVSVVTSKNGKGRRSRQFVSQEHQLEVVIAPAKNHQANIRIDHLRFDQPGLENQTFLDAWYRIALPGKKKIDVELRGTNLLNRSRYLSLYNDGFVTLENSFLLRPRQFLLICRLGL